MKQLEQSPTEIMRTHLEAFRRESGWSRESLAQAIVDTHESIGAHVSTDIQFARTNARDMPANQKIWAQRIYRWLDGDFHSTNLPADILPTLLAVLPVTRRLAAVMGMFSDTCGLTFAPKGQGGGGFNPLSLLATTTKETSEAAQALINLAACPSEVARKAALIEAREAEVAIRQAAEALEGGVF